MHTHHSLEHTVVRAAAWGDGGAEFIYHDGTILSFMDDMNTFVAVRNNNTRRHPPNASHLHEGHPTSMAKDFASTWKEACNATHTNDESEREMCFTAWTLSGYESKVRAALSIYNSLAERPRLISTLLPDTAPRSDGGTTSCVCGVWRAPGPPIHALLLEKRPDLFTRFTVYGNVLEWLLKPSAAPPSESTDETTTFTLHDVHHRTLGEEIRKEALPEMGPIRHTSPSSSVVVERSAPQSLSSQVPVGTVLELWCALRRVRLTVAVHRKTFTVRWPASVTRPDGSRRPPPQSPATTAAYFGPSTPPRNCDPVRGDYTAPLLFTYVEQTFPVCDPPPAWRVMLQMALELDAELPLSHIASAQPEVLSDSAKGGGQRRSSGEEDAPPQKVTEAAAAAHVGGNANAQGAHGTTVFPPSAISSTPRCDAPRSWLGELPDPHHWGGVLNHHRTTHPCRFSSLSTQEATHLAAPRTARALDAMRRLHTPTAEKGGGPAARLCWLYEANRCTVGGYVGGDAGGGLPAVYWCLAPPHPTAPGSPCALAIQPSQHGDEAQRAHVRSLSTDGADVLAWVPEDGSVVHVRLEGQGYTVLHSRLSAAVSTPAVYRLDAESAAKSSQLRLPPLVAPLRCRLRLTSMNLSSGNDMDEAPASAGRSDAATGVTTSVAVVYPLSFFIMQPPIDDAVMRTHLVAGACPTLATLMELTPAAFTAPAAAAAHPFMLPLAQRHASTLGVTSTNQQLSSLSRPHFQEDARRLRCGRYLAAIADTCVQLSQLNCAVERVRLQAVADRSASTAVSQTKLAAYCRPPLPLSSLRVNTASTNLTPKNDRPGADGTLACPSSDAIVYLTSQLEGIGTFTALTNGTLRGHFADRAIVTLIPGANELDESQLVVTGVLPNAQRCRLHAVQCRPSHPVFRYLTYLLPFRRFVYLHAMQPSQNQQQQQQHYGEVGDGTRNQMPVHNVNDFSCESFTASALHDGGVSPVEASFAQASISCLLSEAHASDDDTMTKGDARQNSANAHEQQHGQYWPESQAYHERVVRCNINVVECDVADTTVSTATSASRLRWGIADGARTLQAHHDRERAELVEREARLRDVLADNESLSHATRALLRE